jgi:signal transduction histidine kinase
MFLVCGVVGVSSGLGLYFSYQENLEAQKKIQVEKAKLAATQLQDFFSQIEKYLFVASLSATSGEDAQQQKLALLKVLRVAPAVTDIQVIDRHGIEKVSVSRLALDHLDKNTDRSGERFFTETRTGKVWYSSVFYLKETEPYIKISLLSAGRNPSFVVANINLKFIYEVIGRLKIGETGYAYVVDTLGDLIASPDTSAVLKQTNLSQTAAVTLALASRDNEMESVMLNNQHSTRTLTTFATVVPLGWKVLVELPDSEIYAALNPAIIRTAILISVGFLCSILAGLYFSRKMSQPIHAIQEAAHRIASEDFPEEVYFGTITELHELAIDFNLMSDQLRTSRLVLERSVQNRTKELLEKSFQLEVANKHKSDFLANMSHELRTPLNAVIGFSEILLGKYFGELNDKQQEYVSDIHRSGKHLLALINDVLDVSKIEAGELELNITQFNIHQLVEQAIMLVKARADAQGIEIVFNDNSTSLSIRADERRLKQIIVNLLTNAVKFSFPEGKVLISYFQQADRTNFEIKDFGIGIAPENQAQIFEQFKQLGNEYTNKGEGTGLGLAITKNLVQLHGGEIGVHSEEDRGSTFYFYIPTLAAEVT